MRRAARVALIAAAVAAVLVASAAPALAHGIGGRADLPVPAGYFAAAAGVVLVVSFVALSSLWREPRLQGALPESDLGAGWYRPVVTTLRVIGVTALLFVIVGSVLDGAERGRHLAPVLVWVGFWLVVPFLAAVIGNWYLAINPWRTLARWLRIGEKERPEVLERIGIWPAGLALVAFTWLELVSFDSDLPRTLATAAVVYTVYLMGMAAWAGRETGIRAGDAFGTYNELISSIAPFGWHEDRITRRGWLRALPSRPDRPGLVFFVVAMIGTVTYDGISQSEWWEDLFPDLLNDEWFGTVGLVGSVAIIGGLYLAASWFAARLGGRADMGPIRVARRFAHTLVPIGLAYAVAHYISLVLYEGQLFYHRLSDPLDRGWNLFGTAGWRMEFFLSPEVIWYIQLAFIVAGHVVGVVLAHDRALADFDETHAVRTQYAMLLLMIGLTALGLFLLAG